MADFGQSTVVQPILANPFLANPFVCWWLLLWFVVCCRLLLVVRVVFVVVVLVRVGGVVVGFLFNHPAPDPPPARPKFRSFFPLPPPFRSFSLSLWVSAR